jgi:alkylhydroperoxidase/carboxymuconolactone decarboxylase family protein YurZ
MDKVFGEDSHKRIIDGMNDFNTPVMEYMVRNVWDGIWSGDGIEKKYRSLIVIR